MQKTKTVIEPAAAFRFNLSELWRYRELAYFFAWRDLKVKYRQTALGVGWALLQPLGLMLLFTLLFSKTSLAYNSGSLPYTLFVLSGLVLWHLFYAAVSQAADSMVSNAAIIKKIYFPKLIIPLSALFTALIDFTIAFFLLLVFLLIYKQAVSWTALLFFPAAVGLCLLSAFGLGTLLSALNVKYRDFRYALPFLLQALFFSTQLIYPASIIKEQWLKYLFALNPVNAAIELFRIPMQQAPADKTIVLVGAASAFILALLGFVYFKKTEAHFADIV